VRGRGVAKSSTVVVRTGVDVSRFRPDPASSHCVYEMLGIPRYRRIIVYMGHLHERKGVRVLMRAAGHLVLAGRDDIHVLFLGNHADEVMTFDADCSDGRAIITFGGYQSDIPALLSGCYAGCIPSTGWDSYPMSSLEMQACGLPVIVSDCQGCPETVDNQTGIVVPANDAVQLAQAILRLADNRVRRELMSLAAAKRIRSSLTVEHQVSNLTSLLKEF